MITHPTHNISAEKATDLLKDGLNLIDFYIDGEIKIETNDTWEKEVVFENCIIEYFSGSVTHFDKPVRLVNCHFKKCQFVFTYFLGGLIVDNCTFDNYLDFQAGGHNKIGNPLIITNNEFKGFVNFFDCWYENEVIISNNKFHNGTNLFGNPFNIPVTFDKKPIVKDNFGQLDLDNEGGVSNEMT
ncbi:hypothetical protein FY528_13495 [Hymenobacter lutimineralis]|uniref:Right-handed parallel beta-helix repeat-containing protein n=1 Tax=Hymenobacter lutimineralis TaxID=2606448 RepID=A0A5D6UZ38_9BACT|nr:MULTISPECIES: hypothetical protein [Hymenobacter]QIX63265.1 hypothetical protein HER32_19635 [Hymenobacter sp. BT18]TYZ08058.1 hypothetical protein FY528_13495 [Hymenobacter lutimineralis]